MGFVICSCLCDSLVENGAWNTQVGKFLLRIILRVSIQHIPNAIWLTMCWAGLSFALGWVRLVFSSVLPDCPLATLPEDLVPAVLSISFPLSSLVPVVFFWAAVGAAASLWLGRHWVTRSCPAALVWRKKESEGEIKRKGETRGAGVGGIKKEKTVNGRCTWGGPWCSI